jgi:hypothetical protein
MARTLIFVICVLALAVSVTRLGISNEVGDKGSVPTKISPDTKNKPVDFDRDIRPILSDTCFLCHGPDEKNRKGGLRLDTKKGAFADISGKKVIVPGHPEESVLYQRISHPDDAKRMPPAKARKQLNSQQVELIRRWIAEGAKWEKHWSFVPPVRPALPKLNNPAWPQNAIDFFVLEKLEQEGLQPSPDATKEKLLRRVTLDLTGLPPTLTEMDAFLVDKSPQAYEKVVDRLLASPRYGEHMALEWLDAARYADSNGYQSDATRTMWPWRDWVIKAMNNNMPFDQFTIEQLAGDLLPGATVSQKIATGFNRNHMLNGEGGRHPEESRVEYVVDRVETTATVWLGLTMGCGRCHSHKYDPITQKEFYQFYAYFNNIAESGGVDRFGNAFPVLAMPTPAQESKLQELKLKLADLKDRQAKSKGNEANDLKKQVEKAQKDLQAHERSILEVMVMEERKDQRPTFLLKRGAWNNPDKSQPIHPGVPAALQALPKDSPASRLGLALWLTDPGNPLTARVTVNRYWQHFFGTGLVKTLEDFGSQGERPSHPRLLDWLAAEFVESGWNVKHLHKLMVMSATYRQSSKVTAELLQKDPHNRWLTRGPRQRLSSLALRDQSLALSGLLVEKLGGPPVKPYQPGDLWFDFSLGKIKYEQDHGPNLYRRSIYTFWRRSVGPTMFFDTPARQVCTVNLPRTNTPLQALTLMNDMTYIEAARLLAQHVMQQAATPDARLALAFRIATGRHPVPQERKLLLSAYHKIHTKYQQDSAAALKLLNTGEMPRDEKLNVTELAATTGVMNLILNLDEVITKE